MITWIAEPGALGVIAGDNVALIGDSLAVGLDKPLRAEFPALQAASKGGTDIRAWLTGFMSGSLNSILAAKPSVLLISLGTNDTAPASQIDAATLKTRVGALVDKVRAAGVGPIWLLPGTLPWSTDALLSSIAATGVRTIEQPAGIPKPDKIHPSGEGYKTWAQAIAKDVRAPESTGVSRRGGLLSGALILAAAVGLLWATLRVGGRDADLDQ